MDGRARSRKTLTEVIADKFVRRADDECWEWTASRNRDGYGQITRRTPEGRTTYRAHRVVYELLVGPIPHGLVLDHLCRNPSCVNPAHLEPVTNRENLRRGEGSPLKSHCVHGHALTEDNIYYWRGKRKQCLRCVREGALARYYRRKAALSS